MRERKRVTLDRVQEITSDCMARIQRCFKPGAKITVLVRTTSHPDGSRDFVMTDDDIEAAIAALRIRTAASSPQADDAEEK
jgi:hypothetical protein